MGDQEVNQMHTEEVKRRRGSMAFALAGLKGPVARDAWAQSTPRSWHQMALDTLGGILIM